jgi:hypothetical protein
VIGIEKGLRLESAWFPGRSSRSDRPDRSTAGVKCAAVERYRRLAAISFESAEDRPRHRTLWSLPSDARNSSYPHVLVSVMSALRPTDDQLVRKLLAPPELDDGVESLDYWHRRGRRLPWYRFGARREAVRMTALWERRVGAAVLSQEQRASLDARLSAGALVARTRVGRWMRRARFAVLATMTSVFIVVTVVTVALLSALAHVL